MAILRASKALILSNKPNLVTYDLDEAHAHLSEVFWPHKLDTRHTDKKIHVRHNMAKLGNISFNAVTYGCDVTTQVVDSFSHSYIFIFTLTGVLEYHEGNKVISSVPDTVYVMNPGRESQSFISNDHIQLSIKLEDQLFHQYLEREFSIHVRRPLLFSPEALSISHGAEGLGRLINMVGQDLNYHNSDYLNSSVTKYLEQVLIGLLLTELPHNYRDVLDSCIHKAPIPRYIRLAQDYIHANARHSITINTLSGITNVTTRALQAGFRRYLETTPIQYIRDYRLDIAYQELRNAAMNDISVTEIAFNAGFNDLSKFARYYRARFGENPSVTMRNGTAKEF